MEHVRHCDISEAPKTLEGVLRRVWFASGYLVFKLGAPHPSGENSPAGIRSRSPNWPLR